MPEGSVLIVGGTGGLGREIARHFHGQGDQVVITGRDPERAAGIASDIGDGVLGLGVDLSEPGR
jgi:NAD(P)-dependent dehydrogenase (short-subunit alcohol dehydrogenase family)